MSDDSNSEDFKAIRITLSQEAFDRMEKIMKDAKFRSYSSTIEECIRITHDIMSDIYLMTRNRASVTAENLESTMQIIIIRMARITGRTITKETRGEEQEEAAKKNNDILGSSSNKVETEHEQEKARQSDGVPNQ